MCLWWHFFVLKPKANTSNLGATLAGLLPSVQGLPWCRIHKGSGGLCLFSPEQEGTMSSSAVLCHAQLVCARRPLFPGPKGCPGTLLLAVLLCDQTWHQWQVLVPVLIQALLRAPHRPGLFLGNSIFTMKQPLLRVPHSFSKHLQAFSWQRPKLW